MPGSEPAGLSGSEPARAAIPACFRLERERAGRIAVRLDDEPALRATGFGLASDGAVVASDLAGRRPLTELRAGPERFVVRAYSHGGLARWITGRRFLDPERPFRELAASEHLRAAGVLTPRVVAARARRAPLAGWHLTLVTRLVPGAEDLGRRLARVRRGELARIDLRPWIAPTARAVRALHDAGLDHADLNPHNLLLRDPEPVRAAEVWVLDLDRSELSGSVGEEARRANLRRLYRHVRRRDASGSAALTRTDCARFLRAYGASDEPWRERFAAIAHAHQRGALLHRIGWLFERLVRRERAPRA